MPNPAIPFQLSRRAACAAVLGVVAWSFPLRAAPAFKRVVHKDPNCSCCGAWVKHLESAGLPVTIEETTDLDAIRARLGVPADLAACHTAEVDGYVVEGHVPAIAIKKLLVERPDALGLSVPGMPPGSPGMGGNAQQYSAILFEPNGRREYMKFVGLEIRG